MRFTEVEEMLFRLLALQPNTLGLAPKTLKCVGWGATVLDGFPVASPLLPLGEASAKGEASGV